MSGAIYRVDINLLQLMGDIYSIASYTNPLHPDIFPGICKMEAEVVRIVCNLFHGDEESCGTVSCFHFKMLTDRINLRCNKMFSDDQRWYRINLIGM